ncbi:MAG: hypothetical protein EOP88_11775 [Verrucomicrobiaceae bacterium]|nr:MAG: hypothetical protein EOP88_11775 [Verrucomicrobiaceae bacterium]
MSLPGKTLMTLLLLVPCGLATAHVGMENTTDVRIHADRMEIVTRTSYALAWGLLGGRAPAGADPAGADPAGADPAGQAAALPLLKEEAPRLLELTTPAGLLVPVRTDCVFEVQDDVAFTLVFPRPKEWPVTLRAGFTRLLGDVDQGRVSVFDHTDAGYRRDMEPFVVRPVSRRHPTASFSLEVPRVEVAAPATEAAPQGKRASRMWLLPVTLVAAALVFHLARRRQRSLPR